MSLWQNLFGKSSDKFQTLEDSLSVHERNSEQRLQATHPHVAGIFDKHKISLRNIRKHSPKIAAAAAVLGAFLAIPHLIGQPTQTTPSAPSSQASQDAEPLTPPGNDTPLAVSPPPSQATTGQPAASNNLGTPSTPPTPPQGVKSKDSKSKGHIFGRSYLAPPKEHGFHDLGLHKGEAKNPKVPEIGPHPSELDVNKGGKNS